MYLSLKAQLNLVNILNYLKSEILFSHANHSEK